MMELIWVGSAFISGLIAARLTLPPLVGYLLAGYVLHSLNIAPLQSLNHLADIGIELLLFTVGLKIKPKSLIRREVLSVGGLHLLIMAIFSALFFLLMDKHITGGLVLGISLSFSSTVLAIKVLEDNGELSSLHGRDVISILILQDIVAISLLAFAEGEQPTPWALCLFLLPLLRPVAHRLLSMSKVSELKLLLGVSFALAGAVLAERVGVAADIGALLTGVTLANHAKIEEVANKLWSLKELFLVAFFLQIGLEDFPNQQQVLYALALLAALPIQGVLFFGLFILAGMRARTAFVSSLALTTYSEFALITTGAVIKADLLTAEWKSIISVAVAGSLAIAAPLNRASGRLFDWCEPLLVRFEKKNKLSDCLPDSFGSAQWLIMGMGRTGMSTYQSLIKQQQRVIGIDADPIVLESLLASGFNVVYADVSDGELWSRLPLEKINGVILTLPSFDNRIRAISQLRKNGFKGKIGTICYLVDDEWLLTKHGASFVIHPLVEAGVQLANQMLVNHTKPDIDL
ncbi:cation:proton antiporter family protein [Methylomonas sp. AM2-LC]|uniref:cation:proton antiporter family protein n=1 Tax=Methylomonas sp. AM2-LC TaxID=3153301 RepID=UPI00326628F6